MDITDGATGLPIRPKRPSRPPECALRIRQDAAARSFQEPQLDPKKLKPSAFIDSLNDLRVFTVSGLLQLKISQKASKMAARRQTAPGREGQWRHTR